MGKCPTMERLSGVLFGLVTHLLFGLTILQLFVFLSETRDGVWAGSMTINALLALQFAIPHSILLHPSTRKRLSWIPAPFYGCFFTVVTMASLWLIFLFWRQHPLIVWQATGWAAHAIHGCFLGSWVALLYSIRYTGFGWQTGWTPWLAWFQGKPQPRREFRPRGIYRFLRHPIYFSFLGLLWFCPTATLDRILLVAIWTAYIAVGSVLKDERLAFYMGNTYRAYQQQVPGYPFLWFGPWGRLRVIPAAAAAEVQRKADTTPERMAA